MALSCIRPSVWILPSQIKKHLLFCFETQSHCVARLASQLMLTCLTLLQWKACHHVYLRKSLEQWRLPWYSAVPKIVSVEKNYIARINAVTTIEINGATHHVIIPQYPAGNQTGQFVASYCRPELGHSRPILNKERQDEQRLKWKQKLTTFKFTIQLTNNKNDPNRPQLLPILSPSTCSTVVRHWEAVAGSLVHDLSL